MKSLTWILVLMLGSANAWGLSTPQAVAPSSTLATLISGATASGSDSLLVMQNGSLIYENYFGHPAHVQSVQSVTKSVCSLAIGILLAEHPATFSLDEPMSDWISPWKTDAQKGQITVRMILNHTSGLPEGGEGLFKADTISYFEALPLINPPGTAYVYSDAGVALLDLVISQVAGMPTDQYVKNRIFDPLQITDWSWASDQAGHIQTGGGLFMKPTDLLMIGKMMLARGSSGSGRQIVPSVWIKEMAQGSEPFFPYGFLFWLYQPIAGLANAFQAYSAYGWGGQYITVFPAKGIVAVRTRDPATIDQTQIMVQGYPDFPDTVAQWH